MGGSALVTWLVLALAIGQAPSGAHLTVSVEHRVTTATAGDDVSLRCNIRTEGALRQVTWYKVLDAGATREKIFSYETFWPLNDTKSTPRQILSHQATVRLADVKLRDHGPYQCHVSVYDRSRMLEATGHVFLNVMVPPSSISLIAADAPAPFNRYEARNFTLVCIVSGGKPAPTVRFKRDGAIVEAQGDALAVPSSPSSLLTNPRGRPRTKEVNDEEEEEQEEMAMADAEKRDDGGGGDDGASWIDPDDTKPDPATSRPGETHAHSRGPGTRGATGSRPQADGDRAVAAAPPPLQPSHKSQGVVAASQAKVDSQGVATPPGGVSARGAGILSAPGRDSCERRHGGGACAPHLAAEPHAGRPRPLQLRGSAPSAVHGHAARAHPDRPQGPADRHPPAEAPGGTHGAVQRRLPERGVPRAAVQVDARGGPPARRAPPQRGAAAAAGQRGGGAQRLHVPLLRRERPGGHRHPHTPHHLREPGRRQRTPEAAGGGNRRYYEDPESFAAVLADGSHDLGPWHVTSTSDLSTLPTIPLFLPLFEKKN
ncbi:immunoglobulin superfamily member 21 isoform X2 [Lethenteron reissneri]|uniref:immunoglobulin superfamily member 21 isoform X2 n=1 Tax=Lethenteron reissneri TaxID=7753 RepID=UPI002AB77EE1|nr:immunoglobulin superfamily member 21 isoform X2 [Lethenteron reissneri]